MPRKSADMKLRDEVRHPTAVRVAVSIMEQFDRSDWDEVLPILTRRFRFNIAEVRTIRSEARGFFEQNPDEQRQWIVHVNWKVLECAIAIDQSLFPSMRVGRDLWWMWVRMSRWIEWRFEDLDAAEIQTSMIIAQQYRASPQYWPNEIEMVIDTVPPAGGDWVVGKSFLLPG